MKNYIRWFEDINLDDLPLVGGKNASLGELISQLSSAGIRVPSGFVVTADAYTALLEEGKIFDELRQLANGATKVDLEALNAIGRKARGLIKNARLPQDLTEQIRQAYKKMESRYGPDVDVAVRSSATAEDLPDASFAGQQESFLNIRGETDLLGACLDCFASLFTDRAIAYRIDKGFEHMDVRLSIGVQKMVRSDLATSGVIFTLDPESGFRNVVLVTAGYGLGENIVAGRIDPDEYLVFKPTLGNSEAPVIKRKMGLKQQCMVYAAHGTRTTRNVEVPAKDRNRFCLKTEEAVFLANWACKIEQHYSERHGKPMAMDIEWAKDGKDGHFYIVQARPETIHSRQVKNIVESYQLTQHGSLLLTGRAIGEKIGFGKCHIVENASCLESFVDGEVLVTEMTDPDWEPIMKRASAIVTDKGGRTCHAAIISRELGIPCVVGTQTASTDLVNGQLVTVSCAEGATGHVYAGELAYGKRELVLDRVPRTDTKILVNVGNPEHAFDLSFLPVDGVGLAREEFIIANEVKVHPLALTRFESITDQHLRKQILIAAKGYENNLPQYFVDKLAEGIAVIAAAFYPREVIVRLSDFKTNEYAHLLGGAQFEVSEANPMIGFRGASRYYDERYRDGFKLECLALHKVRNDMGLTNVKVMVPFCRTPEEGRKVIEEMKHNGLVQGKSGLEVYAMCELPSNVLVMDEFCQIFDGFSIGSNDLTQLILGLDRDSSVVSHLFDERSEAVKRAIAMAIDVAHTYGKKIGICGQAPSDYPDFVEFLIDRGIDSISLNEDAVLQTIASVFAVEQQSRAVKQSEKEPSKSRRIPGTVSTFASN
jgi:pyruvate,water dikinase